MDNLEIYCITHKAIPLIEKLGFIPFGTGTKEYPKDYIKDNSGDNIANKNNYYGETTFHYWYWKNKLDLSSDKWVGNCQYRRFFIKLKYRKFIEDTELKTDFKKEQLKNILINSVQPEWKNFNAVICDPRTLIVPKISKLFKRGFRSVLKDPTIIFNKKKHTIKLHFDMYHGYGNLDKAINVLDKKDRDDFRFYVNNNNNLKANCIFFSKPKIMNLFYKDLFDWLFKCEEIFGFENLKGYDVGRLYSFLTERFTPFWFEKYAKTISWPWMFYDISKD